MRDKLMVLFTAVAMIGISVGLLGAPRFRGSFIVKTAALIGVGLDALLSLSAHAPQ